MHLSIRYNHVAGAAAAADVKADAAVCQKRAKSRSKRLIILVWPGYTPDYRIDSAKAAGLDCEWRDHSHSPPRKPPTEATIAERHGIQHSAKGRAQSEVYRYLRRNKKQELNS